MNLCIPKELDLQSNAFDRSATSAYLEPKERFELSTYCLQNSCSDQLSYFGNLEKFIIFKEDNQYRRGNALAGSGIIELRQLSGFPQLNPTRLSDLWDPELFSMEL